MSTLDRVRARLARAPSRYERAWLTSVNLVGLVVVLGVLFDLDLVLGNGQTGIFRRALYPLVPPAVTLGVALWGGHRRGAGLSAALLVGYAVVLALVGTLGPMLATAPVYAAVGVAGAAVLTLGSYLLAG
ncbi:hypothetical protein [Halorientalis marina]|uniref:hypothetical protein n=1 Tax=Halorientalis marina TaxID=2931976 RepID=UPI001FF25DCD|nr:hypothetical protein [Halorientalis marina]